MNVLRALLVGSVLIGYSCTAAEPRSAKSPEDLVGHVSREQLEALPAWKAARASAHADPDASVALRGVPKGASVTIVLGTWCSDSRRELTRFFDALDRAGGPVPFAVEYVAVDHGKGGWKWIPVFIVIRDDKEVGRIVESAPNGIERDLGALLRGERSGVISGSGKQ
ncbi:MAG: hypothetical protein ACXVEF_26270 [Polyangiales bacterium]